jgi:hypothetical protein
MWMRSATSSKRNRSRPLEDDEPELDPLGRAPRPGSSAAAARRRRSPRG